MVGGQKKMDGWMDKKNRWMVDWIEKMFEKNRWMVGQTGKNRRMVGGIEKWMAGSNNNILFYSANIQFNKNLFSALYKKKCAQHVLTRTCKLKITYIITIDI